MTKNNATMSDWAIEEGLSTEEATRLLAVHGPNAIPPPRPDPLWRKLARAVAEPMSVLLIVAAAVSGLLAGETADAVAILVVVALNVAIGVVQEQRAEGALQALKDMQAPTARVIRDGAPRLVQAAEIVPGDLVLLAGGDQVSADGVLTGAAELEVDESTMTGESLPVVKATGDRIWSGTTVTRGSATQRVEVTGPGTRLGRLAETLARVDSATPLQEQLNTLSVRLGFAAVIIAVLVFIAIAVTTDDWRTAFLTGVALAVAAVPEGLPTAVILALALGVTRMARKGAIVRRLAAVETLGSATVILTDKTGTLTENKVQATHLITGDCRRVAIAELDRNLAVEAARVALLCNDATLDPPSGDAIDLGLLRAFSTRSLKIGVHRRLAERPFHSDRRTQSVVVVDDGGTNHLLTKGAPEAVLDLCINHLSARGEVQDLSQEERRTLARMVDGEAASGARLIALAGRRLDGFDGRLDGLEESMTLVGIVPMRDPVRSTAAETIAAAHRAGIDVLMVTGDHPGTATAIASQAGLSLRAVVTGSQLAEDGIPSDPRSVSIYARVEPEQKLMVVDALRARGEVVAVKGDGVNDAPALRAADIGVAMGLGGTEVARQAADMVITDDDLRTVVSAISEGRAIYDNIRKVVEYLVGGNLSELIVVVGALLFIPSIPVPLLALQLLLINLVTDGLPALALGVDPGADDLMDRPPRPTDASLLDRRRFARLLGRGAIMASGPLIVGASVGSGVTSARSAMFLTLMTVHLGYAFVVRYPTSGRNLLLYAAVFGGLAVVGLAVGIPAARELFDLTVPTGREVPSMALGAALPLVALALSTRFAASRK